jgi:hypothetical protein
MCCHQVCGFLRGQADLGGDGFFGGSACVPDYCVIWKVRKRGK